MRNLDILEAAHGGPFTLRHAGECVTLPSPADLPFQAVLACLELEHAPNTPDGIAEWKRALVFGRWAAHHDLPSFHDAQRLTYLVDHYRSAIVYDLQHFVGVDLGEMWRGRRWRTLLDYIDRLPGHSWYSSAVASDEDHAKMIAESLAAREETGEESSSAPPLHTWTPEVEAMHKILDAVKHQTYVLQAVNTADKNKMPKPPALTPRPFSPLEGAMKSAQLNRRKAAHDALAARLLPHKAAQAH